MPGEDLDPESGALGENWFVKPGVTLFCARGSAFAVRAGNVARAF